MRRKIFILSLISLVLQFFIFNPLFGKPSDLVYQIPVKGTVNPGMYNFIKRGISEAENAGADLIVFEIDTYGGLVDSGIKIRDAILETNVPTATYIANRAWSAGALIALAGKTMIISSAGSIGAAETRPKDEKYISALRKEFKSTAEIRGKNTDIAAAMVDSDIEIENITTKDKLVTLTADEAIANNFADIKVEDFEEILKKLNLDDAKIVDLETTSAERLAQIITHPAVSTFLLTFGFIALMFEAIAPGWGIGGTIGIISLGLFFAGNIITGTANIGLLLLFFIGIGLVLLEIFVVPGFGVTGIGGITCIAASIYFVFPTAEMALTVMAIVMTLTVIGGIILVKIFGTSRVWHKISLQTKLNAESGYTSHTDKSDLLGQKGVSLTKLRPAGTILINNEKIDAVSEGEFIEKDTEIEVIKITGTSIVIRKTEK